MTPPPWQTARIMAVAAVAHGISTNHSILLASTFAGERLLIDTTNRTHNSRSARALQVYRLSCEYSKSGRAACGRCSEKIGKGEVRVGRPIKWGGGANGFISTWQR